MSVRPISLALCGALCVLAIPAAAQTSQPPMPPAVVDAQGRVFDGPVADQRPVWQERQQAARQTPPGWEQARADWLAECRRRHGSGNKVGAALVGGVIGGVVGNRVAGKGNRVIGTVAGATVGAVAGGAIGDAADKRAARDYCETYLDQHTSWSQGGGHGFIQGQQIVGYGHAPVMVMMPVAYVQVAAPAQPRECVEAIVTEEWVTVPQKGKVRHIPPRPRPDKRVRIVPDKRIRTN